LQSGVEKLLAWPGIETATSDLRPQSGALNLSAMFFHYLAIIFTSWRPKHHVSTSSIQGGQMSL